MLTILANSLRTASRTETWDTPRHWTEHHRPYDARKARQIERERKLSHLRSVGMW